MARQLKVTQINQVSRNQLHSTEFLLPTFEFESQNIAGCCKQTFCVQFSSEAKHDFFQFSQLPAEWAHKFKFQPKKPNNYHNNIVTNYRISNTQHCMKTQKFSLGNWHGKQSDFKCLSYKSRNQHIKNCSAWQHLDLYFVNFRGLFRKYEL